MSRFIILPSLFFLGIVLSGCMMMGMHGGMMGHSESHAAERPGEALVKEVIVNGVSVSAEFPPARVGSVVRYVVKIVDARSGEPIQNAKVHATIERARQENATTDHTSHVPHTSADSESFTFNQRTDGSYSWNYEFKTPGVYDIRFEVYDLGEEQSPVVLSARREVQASHKEHGGIEATPVILIGAAVMGAMMVWQIARFF